MPESSAPEPLAVSLQEAAGMLRVHVRTVKGLVASGQLPVVHVGAKEGKRIIPVDAIREWLNTHATRGAR